MLGWHKDPNELRGARKRLETLLGLPGGERDLEGVKHLGQFNLGNVRTLDELIWFTGIDLRKRIIKANRCTSLR